MPPDEKREALALLEDVQRQLGEERLEKKELHKRITDQGTELRAERAAGENALRTEFTQLVHREESKREGIEKTISDDLQTLRLAFAVLQGKAIAYGAVAGFFVSLAAYWILSKMGGSSSPPAP
jgi:CRISPR/Cas system CSM-associated protein Csm2 small subunit